MVSAIRFAELYIVLAAALHLVTILAVGFRAAWERRPLRFPPDSPGVTILRPVCGLENHIEATLASAFQLNYPRYEILFCVASAGDPIVAVVKRLMAVQPKVPARLLVGDDRISINPKLNNIVKGWEAAAYGWIVMADSNVLMPPDYIERLLTHWDRRTGIVSAPPVGAAPDGISAELECGFLNTYQARWQLAADAFGLGFAHGKTMLWRREILDGAGGTRALASQPAEDAAGTQLVRDLGLRARLVPNPFPQPLGKRRFVEVWKRQLRWARLRRVSFGLYFYPEILSGGFLPLCIAIVLAALGALPIGLAAAFAVVWYGTEALLAATMRWPLFGALDPALDRARPDAPLALARRHLRRGLRLARQRDACAPPRGRRASAGGRVERQRRVLGSEPERLGDQLVGIAARGVFVRDRHNHHFVRTVLSRDRLDVAPHLLRRPGDAAALAVE
jgi:ceramide glucosyltransferase